jgi:formylglycine-generating enzyme required for sulfatase activity
MKEQVNIDQLFQKAKTQPVARSFEKTKNEFLKHLSADVNTPPSDGKGSFFTLKNVIIMISSILTISIAAILLLPTEINNKPTKEAIEKIQPTEEVQEVEFVIEETEVKKSKAFVWPVLETQSLQPIQSFQPREITSPIVLRKITREKKTPVNSNYKYYPKLTEQEIADNNKQKKKMVKALAKFDKKQYIFSRSGSFNYQGETVSLQAFFIQSNEVTNLEYRTFLFDLLIQDRKAEFDIAKPEQENWTRLLTGDTESMEEQYFSHEAFNEYPVCNVTRAGAEIYCIWLTKAVNATLGDNEKMNDVRIPTRSEWVFAASGEGKFLPFPWAGNKPTNEDGCFLANFSPNPTNSEMSNENALAQDGAMFTAKTGTYNPERGMYNLSGNVAEMVYEDYASKNNPGTAGGSWLNSEDEIKINGTDTYKGVTSGHPGIGFRIVVTHLNF